jgi:hypothetical protein
LSDNNILKYFYGTGDYNSVNVNGSTISGSQYMPDATYRIVVGTGSAAQNSLIHPVVRGWKYGIYNVVPEFTKCIFRASKFGQLRDMLEQRKDSKIYDIVGTMGTAGRTNPGVRTGPVQIRFRNPKTLEIVRPEQTNSSNLSHEATSSIPYCDETVRNREDPIRMTTVGTFTVGLR